MFPEKPWHWRIEKPWHWRVVRFSHHAERILIWTLLTFGVVAFITTTNKGLLNSFVSWAAAVAFMVTLTSAFIGRDLHDENEHLCDTCIGNVLTVVQPERVQRRHWVFNFAHRSRRARLLSSGVPMLIYFAAVYVSGRHPLILGAAIAGVTLWNATLAWTDAEHNRLRPWCPHCRRRRGPGDDDPPPNPNPEPDPDGLKEPAPTQHVRTAPPSNVATFAAWTDAQGPRWLPEPVSVAAYVAHLARSRGA